MATPVAQRHEECRNVVVHAPVGCGAGRNTHIGRMPPMCVGVVDAGGEGGVGEPGGVVVGLGGFEVERLAAEVNFDLGLHVETNSCVVGAFVDVDDPTIPEPFLE